MNPWERYLDDTDRAVLARGRLLELVRDDDRVVTGRVVDTYTNMPTVKLFAHTEREDAYAREGMADAMKRWQAANRNLTMMELAIWSLNGVLIVVATLIGYKGYAGHEFIPTRNPFEGLKQAVSVCDV